MNEQYFDKATDFNNLFDALIKCCRNVRWKDSVSRYESNIMINTFRLRQQILSGNYNLSQYQRFKIYEPKEREVAATRLKDRQFQMSMADAGFYRDITEHFINDNPACQRNAGVQKTHDRMTALLRKYYNKHGNDGWYLRCDIHHFFPSTNHEIAIAAIQKRVGDEKIRIEIERVIRSFSKTGIGIGLGSQASQLIELSVLDGMDHFIKEQLHIKYYHRYMDDFVLIHNDKNYLKYCLKEIRQYLKELNFVLNPKSTLQPVHNGIYMLQWRYVVTKQGRILRLIKPSKLKTEKRRLKKMWMREINGELPINTTKIHFRSWLADKEKGDC